MTYHLAQINVARGKGPLDSPLMEGFTAQVDAVNAVAESSPGFVWRLVDLDGEGVSASEVFSDPLIIVNMSVWESVEALRDYVYRHHHGQVFRDRKQWFDDLDGPGLAMWWIPAGERPTLVDAKRRLERLAQQGPTAEAFTFREVFAMPTG
jgi:hypothetical protein